MDLDKYKDLLDMINHTTNEKDAPFRQAMFKYYSTCINTEVEELLQKIETLYELIKYTEAQIDKEVEYQKLYKEQLLENNKERDFNKTFIPLFSLWSMYSSLQNQESQVNDDNVTQ